MTRFDLKIFKRTLWYKLPQWLWAAGLIVAWIGQAVARLVSHNSFEALVLSFIGVGMMLPSMVVGAYLIHKSRQELHRIETELFVYETLLKLAYPREYQRARDIKDLEKLFKK